MPGVQGISLVYRVSNSFIYGILSFTYDFSFKAYSRNNIITYLLKMPEIGRINFEFCVKTRNLFIYFINLHLYFANITSCPLNIYFPCITITVFLPIQYSEYLCLISCQSAGL